MAKMIIGMPEKNIEKFSIHRGARELFVTRTTLIKRVLPTKGGNKFLSVELLVIIMILVLYP